MRMNAGREPRGGPAVLIVSLLAVVLVLLSATPARAVTKEGTAEADRIQGTTGSDVVFGFEGDDVLRGKAGDDRLVGGRGDDLLKGGAGRDTYVCGTGFDVVVSDYTRRPDEHVGAGCEAVIFEV